MVSLPRLAGWQGGSEAYLKLENVLNAVEFLLESIFGNPISIDIAWSDSRVPIEVDMA